MNQFRFKNAMEIMGMIGVMVNCVIIGQSGLVQRFWPDLSLAGQIMFVVILEVTIKDVNDIFHT